MFRFAAISLPALLLLTVNASAKDLQLAQTDDSAPTKVEASGDTSENTVTASDDGDDSDNEVGPSEFERQDKTTSVEVFADYNTFSTKREYFNPAAYGVRAYWFQSPNVKWGVSIAAEQFVYETDLKFYTANAAAGDFTFLNTKRKGNAIRYAANGQFFFSDSMNLTASLFAANGKAEKKSVYNEDNYKRTGLTLALGNQWSFNGYTVRWDWLTLTYNFTFDIGDTNVIDRYPSNKNGGMIVLSGLGVGMEW